jgi:hypothetical protein
VAKVRRTTVEAKREEEEMLRVRAMREAMAGLLLSCGKGMEGWRSFGGFQNRRQKPKGSFEPIEERVSPA